MRGLTLTLALALALPGCARRGEKPPAPCVDRGYPRTRGLYVAVPLDEPIPEALLLDPLVDGLLVQLSWKRLQPTAQWPPDWSPLDQALAAARLHGKHVALRIEAGMESPAWIYAAGAKPFPFLWEEESAPGLCAKVQAPLPWDPVYQGAWYALWWSAGKRYNQNTALTHVQITGLSALPGRDALPLSRLVPHANRRVTCRTADNVAELAEAGYTRSRLQTTWEEMLRGFRRAFPAQQLAVTTGLPGFPVLDNDPLAPNDCGSEGARPGEGVEPALLRCALKLGVTRVVVRLQDGAPWTLAGVGASPLTPVGHVLAARADQALAGLWDDGRRAQFLEVTPPQLERLRSLLARARAEVRARAAR